MPYSFFDPRIYRQYEQLVKQNNPVNTTSSNFTEPTKAAIDINTPSPESLPCNGHLVFQITTANGTLPVENVRITLTRPVGPDVYYTKVLTTNQNGKTDPVCLPAPTRDMSLIPEEEKPYYLFTAKIDAENFLPVEIRNIQIFDGITTIQPMDLTPNIGLPDQPPIIIYNLYTQSL